MLKIMKFLLLAPVLLGSAGYGDVTIIGNGQGSCVSWTEGRKADNKASQLQMYWVMGYLSGMNASTVLQKDLLANVDSKAILRWIDDYCRTNPGETMTSASLAVAIELGKNAQ